MPSARRADDMPRAGAWRGTGWIHGAAFSWGLAEATVFFLVPDVLLSALALRRPRLALRAAAMTVLGACLGGALIYGLSLQDAAATRTFLLRVPGVDAHWLQRAGALLQAWGPAGLILGGLTGVPYKLFAALAPQAQVGWPAFLLFSAASRSLRFFAVIGLTHVLARPLHLRLGWRWTVVAWITVWLSSYLL